MFCFSVCLPIREHIAGNIIHIQVFVRVTHRRGSTGLSVAARCDALCTSVRFMDDVIFAVAHDVQCGGISIDTAAASNVITNQVMYAGCNAAAALCKGLRVQPPLSSKSACKKCYTRSCRVSLSICIGFRSFVPEELDMNLTSLKVGIHRHCSINKLN